MRDDADMGARPGRREFVRTSGGLLALLALGGACGEDGTAEFAANGRVRLVIAGLPPGLPSAGTVTITGRNLQRAMQLPAGDVHEEVVPSGTARVVYLPPPGFTVAAGESNEREVTVEAGRITTVSFTVAAATATLTIAVNGLVAGATSGGSAQLLRTDTAGQNPLTVDIPAAGTATVSVAPGSYAVTFTAPAGHQLAGGQANPRTVAVATGQTAAVTFQVTAATSAPALLFFSDWRTALGTSQAARTDGGKWNVLGDPGVGLEVVSGPPVGFPSPHVLRVTARETAGGFARLAKTGMRIPAVGESLWYRWYYRSEIPSTGDNSTHPIESGSAGGLDWTFNVEVQSNTTWRPEIRPGGDQRDVNRARWTGPVLNRGVVYRFELQIHKISNTDFRAHIRVYSAANVLIADDDDFNNYAAGLFPTQRMTLADNPTLHFATAGGANLHEVRAGINSLVTSSYGALLFAYQGCFAVRSDDWCGPYTGAF